MSIKPKDLANGVPATLEYPNGSYKNDSGLNTGDGTSIDKDTPNDFEGFKSAMLAAASIVASGNPDTALDSQLYSAFLALGYLKNSKTVGDELTPVDLQQEWEPGDYNSGSASNQWVNAPSGIATSFIFDVVKTIDTLIINVMDSSGKKWFSKLSGSTWSVWSQDFDALNPDPQTNSNTTAISGNTSAISGNTSAISGNTSAISGNTSAISGLNTRVTALENGGSGIPVGSLVYGYWIDNGSGAGGAINYNEVINADGTTNYLVPAVNELLFDGVILMGQFKCLGRTKKGGEVIPPYHQCL